MTIAESVYQRLIAGEQLGHLEYLVTPEKLALFQEAVEYSEARFPCIAVKEHLHVLGNKYGWADFSSARHTDRYFHPPIPNKRVQVTGWVREKYRRQGRDWLVVETFAVDEDGRELVRSQHTLILWGDEKRGAVIPLKSSFVAGECLPPITRTVTQEKIDRFEAVGEVLVYEVGTRRKPPDTHVNPATARKGRLPRRTAANEMSFAYLHELVARRFGADFRQGGQLSVNFLQPVHPGDTVTAQGVVSGQEKIERRTRFILQVWLENQHGEQTSVGDAEVIVPSPLT